MNLNAPRFRCESFPWEIGVKSKLNYNKCRKASEDACEVVKADQPAAP